LFYRHTSDAIQRILEFNSDGTTNRIPENLATRQDYGAEVTFAYSGLDWLRLDGNFNLFRTQVDGGNIDDSFSADDITWFARSTARFTFWNKSDLQLRFNYRAPVETTQGFRDGIASLDLGFNKDLTENLSLTFSVRDVFNSRRRRSQTFGEGFFRESEFQWRARTFNLSFNYRINQKKKRQRGGGGGDFDGGGEF
jgi:outer membrane receptor for ferrienterochelin and colicin